MDPISKLRVLLDECGDDPSIPVSVYTEDGAEYSIVDSRFEEVGGYQAIAIDVVPT